MHRANSVRRADSMNDGGPGSGGGHSNNTSLLNKFVANQQRASPGGAFANPDKSAANFNSNRTNLAREPPKKIPSPPASNDDDVSVLDDKRRQQQPAQRQQASSQQQQQQVYLKSCLSDGDFNEILIKVNDDQDDTQAGHNMNGASARAAQYSMDQTTERTNSLSADQNDDLTGSKNRRRSSCSDAEESKLTSIK